MILCPDNYLGKKICEHLLGNAEAHLDIPKTHVASYHMVTNLEMPYIPKLGRVRGNMETGFRIGV